jgi:hypothetical protein
MERATFLLAFGFASPWMLWGLALGSVPIIIHLLHRQRYRETPWAAMRFLKAAIRKHARRMRLEQWVLLAVRTAILLLVALALAGPTGATLTAFVSGGATAPTQRILVLDASLSMSLVENGRSRFEQAREVARQLVNSSRQGDVWNLVRIGGHSAPVIIRRPTPQPDAVLRELDELTCLEEKANVAAALKEVEQLLRAANAPPRKEVYLVTDLQAANWQVADASAAAPLRQILKLLPEEVVHVFPVGSGEGANAAVTSLELADRLHLSGRPCVIRAGLQRFGAGASAQTVEFRIDDRVQETRSVNIPSGSETVIEWSPSLAVGEHRLEVRLEDDGLPADNRRGAVVTMRDRLPILLVNGKPSGEPWENATDLLKLALAPDEGSPLAPVVIPESELLSTPLSPYACVFLCNLALITDREAGWLADYLAQGGAVVICAGGQVRLDQYNQVLLTPERSLLPAKLVEVAGDPASMTTAFEFDPADFSHPIVKPFQGNPNSGLELTKTFAYLRTEIPPDRETQVALRFQNGDPAILTAPFRGGEVVLITTSVDREWGTWAVWGHSFVPLMHEVVRFAAADRTPGRQLLVGDVLSGIIDSDAVRSATVTLPGGEQASLIVADRQATFEQTMTSGFYKLDWGPPASRAVSYAVNVDPVESDPAVLDEKLLKSGYPETAGWKFHAGTFQLPQGGNTSIPTTPVEQPWSRRLLLIAFWLLLAEQGLAWRFSVGLAVLGLGLALLILQPLLGISPWLALGVVAAATAALVAVKGRWLGIRARG